MTDNSLRNALMVTFAVAVAATAIAIIGWNLFEFDRALFIYAQALIVSLCLTAYRFTIWLHRPPTWVMFRQSLAMLRSPVNAKALAKHLVTRVLGYFTLNQFVWKRAKQRWAVHWPIMIGCLMALAIVVPLIFGWVWFETPADDLHSYQVMLFGLHIRTIPVDGIEAFLAFHGLVWASCPVVIGCSVALIRRFRDRGDQAVQTWGNDFAPLISLLAIAVSGLLMTISYSFLGGLLHAPVAWLHCLIVCGTLIWLPYSKLFHIPQRTLKLAHMVYEHEAARNGAAASQLHTRIDDESGNGSFARFTCVRCGEPFADHQQIQDLIEIEARLGYQYTLEDDACHYQEFCPKCRRAALVIAQGKRWQHVG